MLSKRMANKTFKSILKFSFATTVWIFLTIKLFVYDIDLYLIHQIAPGLSSLIKYKALVIASIISVAWIYLGQSRLFSLISYISFFPFILIFWKAPVFLYKRKSWNLVFACLDAITSCYVSMKYNFITLTIFSICILLTFISNDRIVLTVSALTMLSLISLSYFRRLYFVLKPSRIYTCLNTVFHEFNKHSESSFRLQEELRSLSIQTMSEDQLKKWTGNLESSVLYNRFCLFSARKLRNYQKSGMNIVAYILMVFILIFMTVISFAAINMNLYKINPSLFEIKGNPGFFNFFYYSFNNLIFNSIPEIIPSGTYSQSALMIQAFFAAFLLAITISLIFSFRAQKHTEELDEAIKSIEAEGERMELVIRDDYRINNIEQAIIELENMKSSTIKIILAISKA